MLCIYERYVGKNKIMRSFILHTPYMDNKIDVEKTARTIVTQINDDSNVRIKE